MNPKDDKRLDRAVQLAAAFIANGDIRLGGSTRENTPGMAMLEDLIATLYARLGQIEQKLPGG